MVNMKNFLKDNWFKVIIVVVILIISLSVAYYFVVFLPHEKILEYQEGQQLENSKQLIVQQQNCSDEALKSYKDDGYNLNDALSNYTDHWNQKLSKCLMEVQSSDSSSGTLVTSKDLYDVLEGKDFGSFTVIRDKKLWEQKPVMCEMYPNGDKNNVQFCNSEAEFDSYVQQYMEN